MTLPQLYKNRVESDHRSGLESILENIIYDYQPNFPKKPRVELPLTPSYERELFHLNTLFIEKKSI